MLTYDSPTLAALEEGRLIIRDLVTIRGWDAEGDPITFCFWTGEDDVTITVVSAIDGASEARDYEGGGTLIGVDPIPWVIGLEARQISVTFSQIHDSVQDMVRGYRVRGAVVEVHRALFSVSTGNLVSTPFARFLGKVTGAPINTPSENGEGSIELMCVSNTIELTRTNTARKSDATQSLRSGDRFRRYSDVAGSIDVWWGEARGE